MQNNKMPALLGALALCAAAPASAALYRCGNVFQDRPCDGPVATEVAHPAGAAPAARRPASAASAEAVHGGHEAAHGAHEAASSPVRPEASGAPAAGTVAAASAPLVRKGPPSRACPNLRDQHTAIEARLRTAARPETIHMYERQLREVERNLEEGNCP